ALPRGSVVTGRIVDEFGEPMPEVQVAAMRYQFIQGRRQLTPAGRFASTNDIGEFRLFGLSPGQYYLSATWRNQNFNGGSPANRLPPGEYTLRAQLNGPSGPDAEFAIGKVTATGDDITGLVLTASKPSSGSGRITVDPASGQTPPTNLMLSAFPLQPGPIFGP